MDRSPNSFPAPAPPRAKPRQSNADYRWTMPKVTAFLEALAQSGRVADAARAVGMSRQSAYRLRARLANTRFAAAFEGARKQGIRARAAASRERLRSQWEGPGLSEIVRQAARHGDTRRAQGDAIAAQGDTYRAQGDSGARQGDTFARKATKDPLDSVTSVTSAG